jgi:hypothetical protein
MPKPTWTTPSLTVVARGKPEETVLLGCKAGNRRGPNGRRCSSVRNTCRLGAAS